MPDNSQNQDPLLDEFFPVNGRQNGTQQDNQSPDNGDERFGGLTFEQFSGFEPAGPSQSPVSTPDYGTTSCDEGLEGGWKGLKGGAQYSSGEIAGLLGADETKERWQRYARENIQSAPESDDSWGYFLGSLVPSTVPSAAAIAAAPFTGGATLPMAASMGALGFSSAGNGMMEYESYKKAKGQEVDPLAKLAVGAAYGGFEAAAERFSLGKLMPSGLGSKFLMKGNVEAAERVGRDMLDTFAKANPSRFRAITRQVRTGMGAEGLEEVATEIGQAATDLMYQEGDDRMETIKQLPANMFTAFLGGSIMGSALGPLSYASQQKVQRDRRKAQGGVVLAQNSADQQTYELIAPVQTEQQRGYQALDPQGNEVYLPEEQVGQTQRLSVAQFDKLLQDKLDTQQFELSQRQPITVATYQGQEVQVKGEDGEGGYYITDPATSEDINVDADQLENIQQIPPEEQMAAEGNPPVDQPMVPDEEPGQDTPGVLQNEAGDFVYPGDPEYEELLQQQGTETDERGVPTENEKRTLTLGTGNSKQQVVLASQEGDSFQVESRTTIEDGQPVVQEVEGMTPEEANDIESSLQSHFDARYRNTDRGFQVQAVPSDPSDPSSPMEVRVTPESAEAEAGQAETERGPLENYEVQAEGQTLQVRNVQTDQTVGPQSPNYIPALEEFFAASRDQYQDLPRVTDEDPNITEQTLADAVSSESENPLEIAETYLDVRNQEVSGETADPVNVEIAQNLINNRFHPSEFNNHGVFFDDGGSQRIIYAQYTSKNAPKDIDIRADIVSRNTNREVTPEDILEFVKEHPGGPKAFLEQRDELEGELEVRFEELTGVRLNQNLAEVLTGQREPAQRRQTETEDIRPDEPGPVGQPPGSVQMGQEEAQQMTRELEEMEAGEQQAEGQQTEQQETQQEEYIETPVIRLPSGEFVEGTTHSEAKNKAIEQGLIDEDTTGLNTDLFRTNTGRIINRYEALELQDVASSERLNEQRAERGRERMDQLLEGEEPGPIEEDPVLGEQETQQTEQADEQDTQEDPGVEEEVQEIPEEDQQEEIESTVEETELDSQIRDVFSDRVVEIESLENGNKVYQISRREGQETVRESTVHIQETGDVVQLRRLSIARQGQGIGTQVQRAVVDYALDQGKVFQGDSSVTDQMMRLVRNLEDDYQVEFASGDLLSAEPVQGGRRWATVHLEGEPVYRVTGRIEQEEQTEQENRVSSEEDLPDEPFLLQQDAEGFYVSRPAEGFSQVEIGGETFLVGESEGDWQVVDRPTGTRISIGESRQDAIDRATQRLNDVQETGQSIEEARQNTLERNVEYNRTRQERENIDQEFIERSNQRKEERRQRTQRRNQEFEQRQRELESAYGLPDFDVTDRRIQSKMDAGAELTPQEIDFANEHYFRPDGYEFNQFGQLVPEGETDTDTRFRRTGEDQGDGFASDLLDPSTSAHASRLASDLRDTIDGWAGRNRIVVAENPEQLPRDVRNLLEVQQGRIGGLYHRGTAYIFTWNLSGAKEADMTLLHEAIGHGGIRGLLAHMSTNRQDFEGRLKELSNEIYESFKDTDVFQDIVDSYGLDMRRNDHRQEAAEEYIARLAETNPDATIIDKVVKFINDILRELGLSNQITNADIKAMLRDARQFMREGSPTTVDAGGQLMRSAFKRSALADVFYGRMNNKIASDLNNKGTPQQFKQTLQAWNRKGEFKDEELEWSGLIEWLDGLEDGPVYRDDVLDFLRGNQIEIQEVMFTESQQELSTDIGERVTDYLTDEVGLDEETATNIIVGALNGNEQDLTIIQRELPDELVSLFTQQGTRYGEHTLPGGQNYRELLLTLPQRPQETIDFQAWFEQNYDQPAEEASGRLLAAARRDYDADLGGTTDAANFDSSHYNQPNILAHVRFNERTDSEGNRILFLEEVQSDWHQAGREQGYVTDPEQAREELERFRADMRDRYGETWYIDRTEEEIQRDNELAQAALGELAGVPDAPFKTTWHELVLKRMLRYGAEHGFDKVGWTTGQQQADRYDLSEQVQRLEYYPATEQLFMINHEGVEIPVEQNITQDDLRDAVGKELSERIIAQIDDGAEQVVIEGPDLETGGEGMKGFYNQMIPRFVSKYTKKWDADVAPIDIQTVEPVTISQGRDSGLWRVETENGLVDSFEERELAEQLRDRLQEQKGPTTKVLAVDITPDMRKDLLTVGQPLFVRLGNEFTKFEDGITSFLEGDIGEGTLLDGGNPSQVLKDAGVPDRPLLVSQHLLKAGQHFGVSDQDLEDLPESLNNPAAVFSGRNPNGQILLVELDGEPALVKLDGTGQTNTIHDIWMGEGITEKVSELTDRNLTRYVDPESSVASDLGIADTETVRFRRMDPLENTPHQFQKRRDRTMRLFLDRMVDVKRIQQGVAAEGGTLTDESNTYRAENRSSGKIETQQEDFKREHEDPLVDEANRLYQEKDVTYEDVNNYLKARHAPERNEYLLERNPDGGPAQSGMSDEQAAEIMSEMDQRGIAGDLEGLAEHADRMSDFVLDKWLESELISQERYDTLQERFDYYVPMRGFAEHMGVDPTVFAGDVAMEGRSSEAGDVLPYLTAMADTAIVAGEKNIVKQHLLNFVLDNWNFGQEDPNKKSELFEIKNVYYRATGETDPETGKEKYEPTFVKPTTEELLTGRVKKDLDYDTESADWNSERSPFIETTSIRVMVEGRPVVIEFTTPHIAQAIKKTNVSDMGWVTSQVARITRFLRHVITQYSPEFGVRNLFRDSMTGYINLSVDFDTPTATAIVNPKTIGQGFAALRRGIRKGEFDGEWGQAFQEFREVGAMTGWWNLDQVRERARNLQRAIEDGGFTENPLQTSQDQWNKMLEWMDDYNRVMENIIRVSTYKHLTEEGVTNPDTGEAFTAKQAADYAKDLTVNFNRKGTESGIIGSWFIFFNAAVQGISRQAQPFFSDHTRRQWRAAAAPLIMSGMAFAFIEAMRYGLGQDDDGEYYYDKINEWTRTHNIMIPNLLSEEPDDFLKIPMAYGYNVYWAIGDMLSRAVYGSVEPADAALELVATAVDAYNPIGTAEGDTALETFGRTFTPTIGKPVMELLSNKDFAGRPIKPEPFPFEPDQPASQQYFPWTPQYLQETADFLNRISGGDEVTEGFLDVSPEHLEYVVDYLGGGAGKFVSGLVNSSENVTRHLLGKEDLELYDIYDVPFARAHYGKVSSGVASDRFRERRDEIDGLIHRYEHYYDTGQTEKANRLYEANEELMRMETDVGAVSNQISSLYDWLRVLENQEQTQETRRKIENIEQQIEDLYDSFNRKYNEIQGEPRQTVTELIFNGQQ